MARIAAEALVTAIAGEHDGDMLPDAAAERVEQHGRWIAERLVEVLHQDRQGFEDAGLCNQFVVVRAEVGGHRARLRGLVVEVALAAEADREGFRGHAGLRHVVHDGGGVQTAAQEGAERDIGDHIAPHRFVETGVRFLRSIRGLAGSRARNAAANTGGFPVPSCQTPTVAGAVGAPL